MEIKPTKYLSPIPGKPVNVFQQGEFLEEAEKIAPKFQLYQVGKQLTFCLSRSDMVKLLDGF